MQRLVASRTVAAACAALGAVMRAGLFFALTSQAHLVEKLPSKIFYSFILVIHRIHLVKSSKGLYNSFS